MNLNLAQINIARMLAPMDHPVMADFVANLDPVNAMAESSKGFIWRLKDETNNATSIKVFDNDFIIINMSVWTDLDALFHFVYHSGHLEVFKRRSEWFDKMKELHMALWYISPGHFPTPAEGVERLNYMKTHGETPYAFTYRNKFTPAQSMEYIP